MEQMIESPNSDDLLALNWNKINSLIARESLIIISNRNGVIIYVNDKSSSVLGYEPEELIGKHTRIFKTGNHSAEFYHNLWETILSGNVWAGEIQARRKKGSTSWSLMSIYPLTDENNQIHQFVAIRKDISAQKELEKLALQKEKQLNSHLELTNDVMGCFDQYGNIMYINPAYKQILGYSVLDSIGTNIFTYIDSVNVIKVKKKLKEIINKPGYLDSMEIKLKRKDGSFITCEVTFKNYLHDPLIKGIIFTYRDITRKKIISQEMNQLVFFDTLTGLPNRVNFGNELVTKIEQANASHTSFAIMVLDIDEFKYYNDSFQHGLGDLLLQEIATRIKGAFDDDEVFISRIGGDEFAFILKEIVDSDEIHETAKKLISSINKKPFKIKKNDFFVTASIGVSVFPESGENSQELLKHAEMAMYQAKDNGKNQFQTFTSKMDLYSYKQFTLRNDSKKALLNNEFSVYYQPRFHPVTNEILSAEALIRWNHPKWGIVSPIEFISMAEESGLIVPLGTWIIRKVCLQIKKWEEEKISLKKISINLSALQLVQPDFVDIVSSILTETGVRSKWIEFEITETVMIDNNDQVLKAITQLRNLGITFALDDFGTGYSSLNYLRKFPFDTVKIDKSLIEDIHHDEADYEIVEAIIALCHRLKKSVVAEGVELKEQLALLQKLHCNEIQGYFYSRPIEHEEFKELLKTGKWTKNIEVEVVPKTNRRNYFRIPLEIPLVADMTIESIGNKKLNIGSSEVLIQNIGPGGLSFRSTLRLPVNQEITLRFTTEILSHVIQFNGHIVRHKELDNQDNQYGVEFISDEVKREMLVKLLNQVQIQLRHKSILPNSRFLSN